MPVPARHRASHLLVPFLVLGALTISLAGVAATTSLGRGFAPAAEPVAARADALAVPYGRPPQPQPEPGSEAARVPATEVTVARSTTSEPSWIGTYRHARPLQLAAGTHTGFTFDGAGRPTGQRSLTLAGPRLYGTTQRAVFYGRSHYFVTAGPLTGMWLPESVSARVPGDDTSPAGPNPTPTPTPAPSRAPSLAVKPAARPDTRPTAPPVAAATTWKTLVLVYRETDTEYVTADGSTRHLRARITDSDLALQVKTAKQMASTVRAWSNGLADLAIDIVQVDHPVRQLDRLAGGDYWFGHAAAAADLDRYAPTGRYDSILVIWQPWNARGDTIPTRGWGLTVPPGGWANGAGYTAVVVAPHQWWITGRTHPAETFVHEWMHQSLGFFAGAGYSLPLLHDGADYGYREEDGSWQRWYRDLLQGTVRVGEGTTGVSEVVWRSGTPTRP